MRTIIALLICAAPLAFAQVVSDDARAPAGTPNAVQPDASGARPGDEKMTCEQIQAELYALSSRLYHAAAIWLVRVVSHRRAW